MLGIFEIQAGVMRGTRHRPLLAAQIRDEVRPIRDCGSPPGLYRRFRIERGGLCQQKMRIDKDSTTRLPCNRPGSR